MNRRNHFLGKLLLVALAVALPLLVLHAYTLKTQVQRAEDEALATVRKRSHDAAREVDAALTRTSRLLAVLAAREELQLKD
jgi:hypothetical protein